MVIVEIEFRIWNLLASALPVPLSPVSRCIVDVARPTSSPFLDHFVRIFMSSLGSSTIVQKSDLIRDLVGPLSIQMRSQLLMFPQRVFVAFVTLER